MEQVNVIANAEPTKNPTPWEPGSKVSEIPELEILGRRRE